MRTGRDFQHLNLSDYENNIPKRMLLPTLIGFRIIANASHPAQIGSVNSMAWVRARMLCDLDTEMNLTTKGCHTPSHCGLPRRLLAMCYDALIVIALLMFAGFVALPFTGPETRAGQNVLFTLYLLVVWYLYFAWCWGRHGATLGMRAWRVRLTKENGGTPGQTSCLLRFGMAFISGLALGMGFLWALFNPSRHCWHDLASRTQLIVHRQPSDRAT